ncbi:MAG: 5-formyltetrahydrofolate cyclo-ligase [Hyphomicrobium sp.]|nr:5-formyltetrahydrofolate cyclo-ligase [Hyphomicrobium sp.]
MSDAPGVLAESRTGLRTAAKSVRKTAAARHGFLAGRSVAMTGLDFASVPFGATIGCFSPRLDEFDPLALVLKLDADDFPLALPVVQGDGRPLLYRSWKPGDTLKANGFGVKEPLDTALPAEPRCILVPLLAFDSAGYRLGMGGGSYARTIAALRSKNKKLIVIGIAFDEQKIDHVPHEDGDQRLDWLLTPSGAKKCRT